MLPFYTNPISLDCVQVMMPIHTRMIFRHFISFFWTSYVSFSRGALDDNIIDTQGEELGTSVGVVAVVQA